MNNISKARKCVSGLIRRSEMCEKDGLYKMSDVFHEASVRLSQQISNNPNMPASDLSSYITQMYQQINTQISYLQKQIDQIKQSTTSYTDQSQVIPTSYQEPTAPVQNSSNTNQNMSVNSL